MKIILVNRKLRLQPALKAQLKRISPTLEYL